MTAHAAKHTPHVLPLKVYLGVGSALLLMTAITVTVAQINLGPWNLVVALVIASVKALLVAFFFMHLFYDHKLYFIAFTTGLLCLTVFIILTLFDTMERGAIYDFKQHPIKPQAAMYSQPRETKEPTGKAEAAQEKPAGQPETKAK